MRLLLANANTTAAVTEAVAAEARRAAPAGTEITAITAAFGPRVITSRAEHALALHGLLDLLARHAAGADAVLIAVSYDTGLLAARELLAVPVVGMTEAALLAASTRAARIGMVAVGRRTLPLYREVLDGHPLGARVVALEAVDASVPDLARDPDGMRARVGELTLRLVEAADLDAVILAGAALAGMARALQAAAPVPLIDGVAAGVHLALALAALGLPKPRRGGFAPLAGREVVGVDPALAALFRGGG